MSDDELRAHVEALAGDPKVGVWFISDEPSPKCRTSTPSTALVPS